MNKWLVPAAAWLALSTTLWSAEYRVEGLKDAPPSGKLAADVISQLSSSGWKVVGTGGKVVCEIWPAKQWTTKADFQPSDTVLYPFEPGSLVAALRFAKGGSDFRGQEIAAGVYTLRYGQQPVDGNHVGTFETRDFLLMLPSGDDQSAAQISEENLSEESKKSAESGHPAIMPLLKVEDGPTPGMHNIAEREWWALRLAGKDALGKSVTLELIVVGKAAE